MSLLDSLHNLIHPFQNWETWEEETRQFSAVPPTPYIYTASPLHPQEHEFTLFSRVTVLWGRPHEGRPLEAPTVTEWLDKYRTLPGVFLLSLSKNSWYFDLLSSNSGLFSRDKFLTSAELSGRRVLFTELFFNLHWRAVIIANYQHLLSAFKATILHAFKAFYSFNITSKEDWRNSVIQIGSYGIFKVVHS